MGVSQDSDELHEPHSRDPGGSAVARTGLATSQVTPYPREVLPFQSGWSDTLAMAEPSDPAFARMLRHWRQLRGLSQLELAARVETTTRHLSYLENGRSRPGRDLVLRIGGALDLPLRTRNQLLAAAGLATEFATNDLESAALAPYRAAILRLVGSIHPLPAFVVDPLFNLVETNDVGRHILPPLASSEPVNLLDAFLGPGPARARVVNFAEVAWSWRERFLRATATLPTERVAPVLARIDQYLSDVPRPPADGQGELVICPTFRVGDTLVRTIGMTMRFGPSRDVTLEELSVDVLCPRDEVAERFFRTLATG